VYVFARETVNHVQRFLPMPFGRRLNWLDERS
jgi:hypothetical protein